jgi:UDP-N-acetylglucosamine/UDP-N-acetylgalactosamine diphosphorylase
MAKYEDILARFKKFGQAHVLAGWDNLFLDQQEELLEDCEKVDFRWVTERWQEYTVSSKRSQRMLPIRPAPVVRLPRTEEDLAKSAEAIAAGEAMLRDGRVAAFLVAGGQGTRLGFAGPKGSYPIGPLSGKTLFQWHAEQIAARSARYNAVIPWYIMTSSENDKDTRRFFEENQYFGLNRRDVFFFTQEMVPCLDLSGKLMLASPSRLAMNPNGHGGSLSGLKNSGALADMKKRGIEIISYFQVDNPLVTVCDPLFVGWHVLSKSDMSSKVMEKNSPGEKIGAVCIQNGKPAVIEYIDLDESLARETREDGSLVFWAGSIAIHMINVEFIERVAGGAGLPWHQSKKKVSYFAGNRLVKPDAENAVKFETFVFDALPQAKGALNLEVLREHEFAPVKNAEGADSVSSCRLLLSNYFTEWLAKAGVPVPVPSMTGGATTRTARPVVEVSPLYSLDSEEFAGKVRPEGLTLERCLLLG